MTRNKYYVVWEGVKPGIYETWSECQNNIKNYPGARYKSFKSLAEAEAAYFEGKDINWSKDKKNSPNKSSKSIPNNHRTNALIINNSISVDAACSGNPGIMEYRGVETISGKQLFIQGPFEEGTNNVGEFLALVHGLAYLHKMGNSETVIYTDSKTAMAWVRNKKVKTTLAKTPKNKIIFDLMERALSWLHTHSYSTKIIKWDTKNWGEIPADFGRK